jgi:predicted RNase H-like HicB family nuclease
VVAQGDTRDEVMREIKSAIEFHLETFGEEDFNDNFPVLDAFISETEVANAP